jgi:hypothetical protein
VESTAKLAYIYASLAVLSTLSYFCVTMILGSFLLPICQDAYATSSGGRAVLLLLYDDNQT